MSDSGRSTKGNLIVSRILKLATPALVVMFALSACGGQGGSAPAGAEESFPMTVQNCGRDVTIEKRPERVFAYGTTAVTLVYAAGGIDKLVGREDETNAPYTPAMEAAVKGVQKFGSGGELSRETLIGTKPDLVIGAASGAITPETLGGVGIPMLNESGWCGSGHGPGVSDGDADFDDVFSDIELYGRLLGTQDKAAASVADLRKRVDAVKSRGENARGRSAAMLNIYQGVAYAYGTRSTSHTQLEILGFTNVFGGVEERVFETNVEQLIASNPDVLVLLSYEQTAEEAKNALLGFSGITELAAVKNDNILVHPFEYSGPGTLSVEGLENLASKLLSTK